MKKISFRKVAFIVALFSVATAIASHAQTFTTLFNFSGINGENPYLGSAIQGTDGNFYGTSVSGGKYGYGEIFEIMPTGTLSRTYGFCAEAPVCPDGQTPHIGLMQAANGNLFGMTAYGGTYNGGTLYALSPSGHFTTLYSFANGTTPQSVMVQGVNGDLYGTSGNNGKGSYGTIFAVSPTTGTLTTAYTFCSQPACADGTASSSLVLAPSGKFYGVTADCGVSQGGTVFEITPAGKLTTLYGFNSNTDGAGPSALVLSSNGNFYGTMYEGGTHGGHGSGGTVFEITPAGKFTIIYNFCSQVNCTDGELPAGGMVQGSDGNLYGITSLGGFGARHCSLGTMACGTIFKITPAGQLTNLYSFCSLPNCVDGTGSSGLVQGTDGSFYGSTDGGGYTGCMCGTFYSLSVGLGPFVKANPDFGKVGYKINILGNNLTGATNVTFNGMPATFTVVSNTYIKATVPSGATTGTIEVTTSSSTLFSNVPFQVK